ncbi:MAG: PilZ domain-containing protein [Deltaproteobacteria bacterium]|nr:PilZ domain-containing protein [Deltaproteobacteria bacterium]MBW2071775.1 PilZ domain-containing protein [Deltaproteobacteria bacterium]
MSQESAISEQRACLRTRIALPVRYTPLSAHETELVNEGKANLIFGDSAPVPLSELSLPSLVEHQTDEEVMVLRYLQVLDAKLNWIIEQLQGDDKVFTVEGQTIDIGGNGLCFRTSTCLPVGSFLKLRLRLPATMPVSVNLLAEVLRVDHSAAHSGSQEGYVVAVRFLALQEEQREQIIQFIFGHERRELRRRKENSRQLG